MRFSTIQIPGELLDADQQRWYLPLTLAYQLASSRLGIATAPEQSADDYSVEPPFVLWKGKPPLESADQAVLELRGSDVGPAGWAPLLQLAHHAVSQLPSAAPQVQPDRATLLLKSYLDAQRHVDEGDVIAALASFAAALEALLNTELQHVVMHKLIEEIAHPGLTLLKADLHWLRATRNRIHPAAEAAAGGPPLGMADAQRARGVFERVLLALS